VLSLISEIPHSLLEDEGVLEVQLPTKQLQIQTPAVSEILVRGKK